MGLSMIILGEAGSYFDREFGVTIDRLPSFSSACESILIGTVIPLASSILPVRAAFQLSLADSLDT